MLIKRGSAAPPAGVLRRVRSGRRRGRRPGGFGFQSRPTALLFSFALLLGAEASAQPEAPPAVVRYEIEATLDVDTKIVSGQEEITWRNTGGQPTSELYFHLYLNAFKHNRTTFFRESGNRPLWNVEGEIPDNFWGWTEIELLERFDVEGTIEGAIVAAEHVQPDDGNLDDETVLRVELAEAVLPDEVIGLRIRFKSKLPRGVARTGWVDDYIFAGQWFPKLGVYRDGRWNCHQYHRFTEYFADFGVFDVKITLPSEYIVAGTGGHGIQINTDGTTTYRFLARRVHDSAWVACKRFIRRVGVVDPPNLPKVTVRVFVLPEHQSLTDRYQIAARKSLQLLGEWFGPYPYDLLSVVDPAFRSETDGMEYPMLITGRAYFWTPERVLSPESVTAHEVAHQWWYAAVANNEFEEAWLDEGLTSWSETRVLKHAYPAAFHMERFFGGVPLVFESMPLPFETLNLPSVRLHGRLDKMTRPSWQLSNPASYQVNSYAKPEMTLWTLERLLGEEKMLAAMRLYYQRFAFRHAATSDFIAAVNDAAGRDLNWFFEETFNSSELVDYAVSSAKSYRIPPIEGRYSEKSAAQGDGEGALQSAAFLTEVEVRRLGGARMPVEVVTVFEDGSRAVEQCDGRERWIRYKYERPTRLKYAIVDPDRKILLDVDPVNNSRLADSRLDRYSKASWKWGSKWLFWVQNLMETFAFVG